ncbi:MAG: leucine-rich repeat protein [Clostridiales bacterium]|nr:leucine-rich repeat protein [Clostridiales bacterium]
MKNKVLLGQIILLIILFIGFKSPTVKAEEKDTSSDFVIENGVLKKYKGSAKVVIIPDGVKEIGGGEFLGNNGLNYNSTITEVVIPDSVTKIGVAAFYMSSGLSKINIPDSVTIIGPSAFGSCRSLTEINIPRSVTTIDNSAFMFCDSLLNINIPESVTTIGGNAFLGTPWLDSKRADAESGLVIVNNILIDARNVKGEVTVPEGVIKLADSGMSFSSITKVTLPKTLTEIGKGAFSACVNLKEVQMKDNVAIIGDYAFEDCDSLEVLQLPKKLKELGSLGLKSKVLKRLKTLEIPASVEVISKETLNSYSYDAGMLLIHENSPVYKYIKENNLKDVRYKVIGKDGKIKEETYMVVKVKKGETLWKISLKYLGKGTRYKEIMKLNNLKKTTIHVGQKLKVPVK